jgi:hypothetical protein
MGTAIEWFGLGDAEVAAEVDIEVDAEVDAASQPEAETR